MNQENNSKEKLLAIIQDASPDQLREMVWLRQHPDFVERPVDIVTFVTHPEYLDLAFRILGSKGHGCRPRILDRLKKIFDPQMKYEEFVLCCGIGWGKDFAASIVLSYRLYFLACLKRPQEYYGLSKGTNIHLMLMSINETHARDVLFGEVRARLDNSPWFRKRFPYNPKVLTSMIFPKNIWLIPGNSKDTSFVGYNIFTAIIDEGDDYTSTATRNDAVEGYNAIKDRIVSRFRGDGLMGVIGSPKTEDGFMMTKYKNEEGVPNRFCELVPTWDSLLDTPMLCGRFFTFRDMEIPVEYRQRFVSDPERALRDLGARPAKAKEPFITLSEKILGMFDDAPCFYDFKEDKKSFSKFNDNLKSENVDYYGHIDLAVNRKNGDRLGFAFGHVIGWKEIEMQEKPIIRIDMACVITAPSGSEIIFSDFKALVYYLVEKGFNFRKLTLDSWNSVDMIQSFNGRSIPSALLSVDKTIEPYAEYKEAIYEDRLLCHNHDLLKQETERLELINGQKVDHPSGFSKDCADAVAGTVYNISISNTGRIISFVPRFGGTRIF